MSTLYKKEPTDPRFQRISPSSPASMTGIYDVSTTSMKNLNDKAEEKHNCRRRYNYK